MGQARQKGTYEERRLAAITRNRRTLASRVNVDPVSRSNVDLGFSVLKRALGDAEWRRRRSGVIDYLSSVGGPSSLADAATIRVRHDEIAWYMFLAEQVLENPLCIEPLQTTRNLPFVAALGERYKCHDRVKNLDRKLRELLTTYRADPDGILFEVLVALSYAHKGWNVDMLEPSQKKTPDMRVQKAERDIFVECKRQSRSSAYADKESVAFLRQWDAAKHVLFQVRQWLWFRCNFHVDVAALPDGLLAGVLGRGLPLVQDQVCLHDGPDLTLWARRIDHVAVRAHFLENRVKPNSPFLTGLLGGDWAPPDANVTLAMAAKYSDVVACEAPVLGQYVDDIAWACGMTRVFDSEVSITKKARDIKHLLVDAVEQVPDDKPSIIHIAFEALDGDAVETRRVTKIMKSVPRFITTKPVIGVQLHRFRPLPSRDKLWDFLETVAPFQREPGVFDDVPQTVVAGLESEAECTEKWPRAV